MTNQSPALQIQIHISPIGKHGTLHISSVLYYINAEQMTVLKFMYTYFILINIFKSHDFLIVIIIVIKCVDSHFKMSKCDFGNKIGTIVRKKN